jgi:hypothetical protein
MDVARPRLKRSGSVAMLMAFAALALQLLFPPGFMAGTASQAARGIPIVICTAEGRVTANWDGAVDHDSKKAPDKPMAACPSLAMPSPTLHRPLERSRGWSPSPILSRRAAPMSCSRAAAWRPRRPPQ